MNRMEELILTEVFRPFTVHSEQGRKWRKDCRAYFGLSFCIDGQITYTMGDRTFVSRQGYAVLLPRGASYSLTGDREGRFPVINFQCEGFSCEEILVLPLRDADDCLRRFEALRELFAQKEGRLQIFSAFYALLGAVLAPKDGTPHPLQSVVRYVEDNLHDPALSNTRLAQRIGISEVYLRRLFWEHLGLTPKQYVLEKRLRRARELLVDTALSVTEVAQACGFSSPYHFCRAFRQKTGTTPTEYARRNTVYQI